jgi:putative PIN family toxin of toxin-antitoxin system
MRKPTWLIDTNVLVSAALTSGGTCDRIVRAAIDGRMRLAWSAAVLAEYREVLSRSKFKFTPQVVSSLLMVLAERDQVTPRSLDIRLPDPDDEIFLATAMATPDQILITGNALHFPADLCMPVRVFTPIQALAWLADH